MTELVIDYSFARPDPHVIKAAGVVGVMRYLSHPSSKDLSAAEAHALLDVGLWIGLNWETTANRAITGGATGGAADAASANNLADSIGAPHNIPIFYSVDTAPTDEQAIEEYFKGVRSQGRRPVGVYGGLGLGLHLRAKNIAEYVWVANAASWSGFSHWDAMANAARISPAHLLQHVDRPLPGLPPTAYDLDETINYFPAWGRKAPEIVRQDMHIDTTSPIVSYLHNDEGVYVALEDGGVLAFEGPFRGSAFGKPYFHGKRAARLLQNPHFSPGDPVRPSYIIQSTTGEKFGLDGF
jgi:hypothetical protein